MLEHIFYLRVRTSWNVEDTHTEIEDLLEAHGHDVDLIPIPMEPERTIARMTINLGIVWDEYREQTQDSDRPLVRADHPFLLVEQSTRDSRRYLTTHATPEAAGRYSLNQEYAGDWAIEKLVDLRTGETFTPGTVNVEWVKAPTDTLIPVVVEQP